MSDKTKAFAAPTLKPTKTKRPSTANASIATTSSRVQIPSSTIKDKRPPSRPKISAKIDKNSTIIGEGDLTMINQEGFMLDFDAEHRQIAYGKFLRAMLEECLVDEKIEREETQMDVQMSQLAIRFQQTIDMLDKTNRRLKDVSFVVEQKRLLDLKSNDCSRFHEMMDSSNAQDLLHNLTLSEQACLDKLETKNIEIGFNKDSGHKQLLDAVNDAIDGLAQIKNRSNLDTHKFEEYEKSQKSLEKLEKDKVDLDNLKVEFEEKFPEFSEKLFKEASDKIAKMFKDDENED